LQAFPLERLGGMEADLAALAAKATTGATVDQKAHNTYLTQFFRLMPLLYREDGQPISADLDATGRSRLVEKIDAVTHDGLAKLYSEESVSGYDRTVKAVTGRMSKPGPIPIAQTRNAKAVETSVIKAMKLVATDGSTGNMPKRKVVMNQIPPDQAIFRACFGKDCTLRSLQFFTLIEGAKTYAVRTTDKAGAPAEGYVLVVPARVGGVTLPYVIGVAGLNLIEGDVRQMVRLVAKDWKSRDVMLPDLVAQPYLVNYPPIRAALAAPGVDAVSVDLGPKWDLLTEYGMPHVSHGKSWYDRSIVGKAKRMTITDDDRIVGAIEQSQIATTGAAPKARNVDILERAILAGQMLANETDAAAINEVLTRLELTHEHLEAVKPVVYADFTPGHGGKDKVMGAREYKKAKELLGFNLEDIAFLDYKVQAVALAKIYAEDPTVATGEEWKRAAKKVNDNLETLLEPTEREGGTRGFLVDQMNMGLHAQKLLLPPEHSKVVEEFVRLLKGPASARQEAALFALAVEGAPAWLIAKLPEIREGASPEVLRSLAGLPDGRVSPPNPRFLQMRPGPGEIEAIQAGIAQTPGLRPTKVTPLKGTPPSTSMWDRVCSVFGRVAAPKAAPGN
jgi:hypothetical protein